MSEIVSKPSTPEYCESWDRVFGEKDLNKIFDAEYIDRIISNDTKSIIKNSN